MNSILDPWGYVETTDYESLKAQNSGDSNQGEVDAAQDQKIKNLEERLEAEIKRATEKDGVHDSYGKQISDNAKGISDNKSAIEEKADKEHTHMIEDITPHEGEDSIIISANN